MTIRNQFERTMKDSEPQKQQTAKRSSITSSSNNQWYSIPPPVRRVFEKFPIIAYEENTLPQRAVHQRTRHTLYLFANAFDPDGTRLSCNPTCLKWQTYLKLNDIDFSVVPSSNHASPSGSLPFLIPASSSNDPQIMPLAGTKISRWISQQLMQEEESLSVEQEAYMSLIDQNIRNAWLYHLYIDRSNFVSVAHPLYVAAASSNWFIQMSISNQLSQAAKDELLKSMHVIDRQDIYLAADKAFEALSILLKTKRYFSEGDQPGLFDASVFAFTQLLLDKNLPWTDVALPEILHKYPQLVEHRARILSTYLGRQ